jgi:gamma-glutamylputrescine oxidase
MNFQILLRSSSVKGILDRDSTQQENGSFVNTFLVSTARPVNIKPLWQALAPDRSFFHDELPHAQADVVIVGGGIVGLSAAWTLLNKGRSVCILDQGQIGGNSAVSAGIINPYNDKDFKEWNALLGEKNAKHFLRLIQEGAREMLRLVEDEKWDLPKKTGWIMGIRQKQDEPKLREEINVHHRFGLPAEYLSAQDIEKRIVTQGVYQAGYFNPDIFVINPWRAFRRFAVSLQSRGCLLKEGTRVLRIDHDKKRVETNDGAIRYRRIVLAVGVESRRFTTLHKRALPYTPFLVATEPLSKRDRAAVGWNSEECLMDLGTFFDYFRLSEDGRLIFGPSRLERFGDWTKDVPYHIRAAKQAEQMLHRMFPIHARVEYAWSGNMYITEDELPDIGLSHQDRHMPYAGGASLALGYWMGKQLGSLAAGETPKEYPFFHTIHKHYRSPFSFFFHLPIPMSWKIGLLNTYIAWTGVE